MLFEYIAVHSDLLFLTASFTGGVSVFYVVLQRTRRKRQAENAAV